MLSLSLNSGRWKQLPNEILMLFYYRAPEEKFVVVGAAAKLDNFVSAE